MLTEKQIKSKLKKLHEGLKYLENYDDLGAKFPESKQHATFTISAGILRDLEGIDNKSSFVETAIKEALMRKP